MTSIRKVGFAGAVAGVLGAIGYAIGRTNCTVSARAVELAAGRRRNLVNALAELDTQRHGSLGATRWRVWKSLPNDALGAMQQFETVLWESTAIYIGDPNAVIDVMISVGFEPKAVPVLVDYWYRRQGEVA